jgi:multiple sugar transport system ATP-binding protein
MATVTFDKATGRYAGATTPAVDNLDLEIEDGELLVLVGPSGCGKSTSLRMLAGLEGVDEGRILIGDRDVTDVAPKDRDIAMVFQNYALYPHMTVAENMGFALKIADVKKDEIRRRVAEAARILDLEPYLDRKPKALSGGQRQRVAMGRAIVRQPQVFLMDEPLSNLDAKLRVQTRTQIAQLQRRLGVTTVYVTHDQVEAMTMGHRVAVLKDGVLQQVGSPGALYDHPDNVFVAGFIGSPAMNLLELDAVDGGVRFGDVTYPVERSVLGAAGASRVTVGVRPEDLRRSEHGLPVQVVLVEELGADAYVYGSTTIGGRSHDVIARVDGRRPPAAGEVVHFTPDPQHVHLFSIQDGRRLGD